MSDSLRPHGLQHARAPCPSPTPRVYPNPCPLSRWWYPTILSSVVPFSPHLQSFPASGSFQISQFFASGGPKCWYIPIKFFKSKVTKFIFLGSKITADSDCSHKIKRWMLLGRKAMTNLDSILKSRDISLLIKLWFSQYSCMDVRVGS